MLRNKVNKISKNILATQQAVASVNHAETTTTIEIRVTQLSNALKLPITISTAFYLHYSETIICYHKKLISIRIFQKFILLHVCT